MRQFLMLSLTVFAGLSADLTRADDAAGAAHAVQIAPYLDDQTVAVGRIDLTRVDVKGLFAQFAAMSIAKFWRSSKRHRSSGLTRFAKPAERKFTSS